MARQSVNDFEPWPPWLSENTMVAESGHKISVLRWRFVMQSTFFNIHYDGLILPCLFG